MGEVFHFSTSGLGTILVAMAVVKDRRVLLVPQSQFCNTAGIGFAKGGYAICQVFCAADFSLSKAPVWRGLWRVAPRCLTDSTLGHTDR